VVFHTTPDDSPIANVPSKFYFQITDKSKRFEPDKCNCDVKIMLGNKLVFLQPLLKYNKSPSLKVESFEYTFTKKDTYTIIVSGTPKTPEAFQSFKVSDEIMVSREANSISNTQYLSTLILIITAISITIYFLKKHRI
ncbi:MAG TPA: hypothetical protein VLI92_02200, partial [Candidatus Saccharimonadales bacterium]|nr:hypothetical protein [Candidatus Saccharimonadales bacterium]